VVIDVYDTSELYLITEGLLVIQRESTGTSQMESPACLLSMLAADYFD
jgi:hypothetical protein